MHDIVTFKNKTTSTEEPSKLRPWLHHSHSLTDKLRELKGSVELTVLSQEWSPPSWWDQYILAIRDSLVFQRTILMKSQQIAYWFARSIIPKSSYDLDVAFFKRLERESIRNLIFESDEVHRSHFTIYPIDSQSIEFQWVNQYLPDLEGPLWVRFAHYSYRQKASFYLLEILLPSLENVSS